MDAVLEPNDVLLVCGGCLLLMGSAGVNPSLGTDGRRLTGCELRRRCSTQSSMMPTEILH